MTAFTAESNIEEAIGCGVYTVLAKPFNLERAADLIARAMARPAVVIVESAGGDADLLEREFSRAGLRVARTSSPAEALVLVRNGQSDLCGGGDLGDRRSRLSSAVVASGSARGTMRRATAAGQGFTRRFGAACRRSARLMR
jgi:CheY-like chemotaxis protein